MSEIVGPGEMGELVAVPVKKNGVRTRWLPKHPGKWPKKGEEKQKKKKGNEPREDWQERRGMTSRQPEREGALFRHDLACLTGGGDGEDFSVVREDEKFLRGIFDEGGGFEGSQFFGSSENLGNRGALVAVVESPEVSETPIAEEVFSAKGGDLVSAIVDASGDRDAIFTAVFVDRCDELAVFWWALFLGGERMIGFHEGPTVVSPVLDDVDFLPSVLPDVGCPEFTCFGMESQTPGIAKSEGENLGMVAGFVEEGVVIGKAVGTVARAGVDIDSQDLAIVDKSVLRELKRIVGFASVAHSEIKQSVGAEEEIARVVVPVGLWDLEKDALGRWVGFVGISRRGLHFAQNRVLGTLEGVVKVELPVPGVVGMKGEAEESFFELLLNEGAIGQVEEGGLFGRVPVLGKDGDLSELLNEKKTIGAIGRDRDGNGELELLVWKGGGELDFRCGGEQRRSGGEESENFHGLEDARPRAKIQCSILV